MKRKVLPFVVLMLAILFVSSYVPLNSSTAHKETLIQNTITTKEAPSFDHVIFITWDGVRPKWFDELTSNGTLVNANRVLATGYMQKVRITNHEPGTDPGLSTMETGYGPNIHGITFNQFGPGSPKDSIPDGLTTAERLKAAFGSNIKIGYFLPWSFHQINESYMVQQGNYTDSIFENVRPGREVDYWFASENLSWVPWDNESKRAAYHGFNEKYQLYYDPLIKASYLAEKVTEFIANYSSERFYIRIHLTEPDNVGHGYGESDKYGNITPEYYEALLQCDEATGMILDALEEAGIYDKTLIILGTDHGFYKETHQGSPWPNNRLDVVEPHFAISSKAIMPENGIAIDQMDLSPTILAVLGVDLASLTPQYKGDADTGVPAWERTDTEAPVLRSLKYQTNNSNYANFEDGITIVNTFNLSMTFTEWSDIENVSLTIEDKSIAPDSYTNLYAIWNNIDLTDLSSGTYNLTITVKDIFGYTLTVVKEFELVNTVKKSPIPFVTVIATIMAIVIMIKYSKRRQ